MISRDLDLLRWVEASAAGTGALLVACDDPRAAVRAWREPALVLLGDDVAEEIAAVSPPRHPQVHLLARAHASEGSLRSALRLGARSLIDPSRDATTVATLLGAVADPRPPGRVVAFCAGSGGAGASTLAAGVALTAARRSSVALLACDPHGPEPALLIGSEATGGLGWPDLEASRGRVAPAALRDALPRHRDVSVLSFAGSRRTPTAATLPPVLDAARAAFDTVVVDVDPRCAAVWEEVVARSDRLWVVTRPHVAALAAAQARVGTAGPTLRLAVRGRGIDSTSVARTLGVQVALRIGDEPRLDEWLDLGAGPLVKRRGPLARAARRVLDDLDGAA